VRAEKWFRDLRLGIFGVKEEHTIRDKGFYGADIYYKKDKLDVVAEWSNSEGYDALTLGATSGQAYRVQLRYNDRDLRGRAFYKRTNDGFQNPSSATALEPYETYGVEVTKNLSNSYSVGFSATVEDRTTIQRHKVDLKGTKKLSEHWDISFGGRWNREETAALTEEYTQATGEVQWRPTEKLSLSVGRDQTLGPAPHSMYYPTRTTGKITYRWSESVTTYMSTEYREEAERDYSVTTAGINSKIGENTTAYSKYTIDDSVSGWRSQSHIGLNHMFKINERFAFDAGLENVRTFSGPKADYTALSLRGAYTQKRNYKLTAQYNVRFGDNTTDHLLGASGVVKVSKDTTVFVRERYFLSEYEENAVLLGFARRPVGWDKLNWLLKLRWIVTNRDENTQKFIFSTHLNYQPHRRWELMGEYATKYVVVQDVGHAFTELLRGRVLYDLTEHLEAGLQSGVLYQHETDTYLLSYGPEVGYMPVRNFWVSVGYNFQGFYDQDFEGANYWAKGPYLKIRIKFDEETLKRLRGKKDEEDTE
ncbi:MAG: hypothetical protein D6778_01455, partial [Nitrospirae bacterium]